MAGKIDPCCHRYSSKSRLVRYRTNSIASLGCAEYFDIASDWLPSVEARLSLPLGSKATAYLPLSAALSCSCGVISLHTQSRSNAALPASHTLRLSSSLNCNTAGGEIVPTHLLALFSAAAARGLFTLILPS